MLIRTSVLSKSSPFNFSNLLQSLPALTGNHSYRACTACLFSTSSTFQSIRKKKVKKRIDPYRAAQARQRKAANQARKLVLHNERREAMGDPIRSKPTPFIESLSSSTTLSSSTDESPPMNFYLSSGELDRSLEYSKYLTTPLPSDDPTKKDIVAEERERNQHATAHANAQRALAAIAALNNGSSKDRTRVNIQRCIAEFGRHSTDAFLSPKPASRGTSSSAAYETAGSSALSADLAETPNRVGADTGSSEVQVAILTAKINTLADDLRKKDKHNKRNLRLLVHRRQKHLSYLRRKERGGPRWQNLVDKLGIGDAMWKGEISL